MPGGVCTLSLDGFQQRLANGNYGRTDKQWFGRWLRGDAQVAMSIEGLSEQRER